MHHVKLVPYVIQLIDWLVVGVTKAEFYGVSTTDISRQGDAEKTGGVGSRGSGNEAVDDLNIDIRDWELFPRIGILHSNCASKHERLAVPRIQKQDHGRCDQARNGNQNNSDFSGSRQVESAVLFYDVTALMRFALKTKGGIDSIVVNLVNSSSLGGGD